MERLFHRIDEALCASCLQRASVITSDSIVAMLGRSCGALGDTGDTRQDAADCYLAAAIFGTVSVVMIPRAAFLQRLRSSQALPRPP
jgi:hypothetical protein